MIVEIAGVDGKKLKFTAFETGEALLAISIDGRLLTSFICSTADLIAGLKKLDNENPVNAKD